MALTITVEQLAVALRISVTGLPQPSPYRAILTRQLAVADEMITSYADGAPEATKNEAAIRICGYLLDSEPVNPSRNVSTPEGVLRNSGAKGLLSRWRSIGSATIS